MVLGLGIILDPDTVLVSNLALILKILIFILIIILIVYHPSANPYPDPDELGG